MKNKHIGWIICIPLLLSMVPLRSSAQSIADLIIQLGLNIEKLAQFKQTLSDLKKGYDIVYKGYSNVKNISEGNFSLHKAFLDGLLEVSPVVRKYQKIPLIIDYQLQLLKEYKSAFQRFKTQGALNPNELKYLESVYSNLAEQSLQNLEELISVTTAGKLRMNDDERLEAIDRIFLDMEDKLTFLRDFNNDTRIYAASKLREKKGLKTMDGFYGINSDN